MREQKYCWSCGTEVIKKEIRWYGRFDETTGEQYTGTDIKITCPKRKWWQLLHEVTYTPDNF